MGALSIWHWLILLVVIAVLIGWKKLPDVTRSLGRSLKIFKAETKGLVSDDSDDRDESETPDVQAKQLPASPPVNPAEEQQRLDDLQRQLDELKRPGNSS